MTNNDFDFIKQQFDESGVNAPDELNEEFVKEKIHNIEPLKVKKSKKKFIVGGIIAASVAILLVNAFLLTNIFGIFRRNPFINSGSGNNKPVAEAKIRNFESRDEVTSEVKRILNKNSNFFDYYAGRAEDAAEAPAADSEKVFSGDTGASGSSGDSHSETYIQTIGVDESDTIKTDGKYIYYINSDNNFIEIYKADNGKTTFPAAITLPDNLSKYGAYFIEFYVNGNRLTAIAGNKSYTDSQTFVLVYDIADKDNIKRLNSYIQSGRYCSSRMIDGKAYVVSSYTANNDSCIPECYGASDDSKEIAPDCIYCVDEPSSANFLVVSAVDTAKPSQDIESKAILGSANDVYCSTENLYVLAHKYDSTYYDYDTGEYMPPEDYDYSSYTQIVKVNLKNNIDFTATAVVKGSIDNQYSLDEKDGNLRVATTSQNSRNRDTNNLYVLDKDLKELGSVTGFADNESIKAVRYIGNTAYVITYEQTDPLFIIDLSNPKNPKITGEVKISGFSSMLVPVDEKTLLGIGYQTATNEFDAEAMEIENGLKLVTFDISDKNNPKIKDTKVFANCDSTVQYNPKALVYNSKRNDYIIPVNNHYYDTVDRSENSATYNYGADSGVLNFRIENGYINITDQYASDAFGKGDNNSPVERCVYISDYIYMLGYCNTIKYSNENANTIIDSVKYK